MKFILRKVFIVSVALLSSIVVLVCMFILFNNYAVRQNISALQVKAQSGDLDSQYVLGNIYYGGHSAILDMETDESRTSRAIYWYKKASSGGKGAASYKLGLIYLHKNDGNKEVNRQEAVYWFERGVSQHDSNSRTKLEQIQNLGF